MSSMERYGSGMSSAMEVRRSDKALGRLAAETGLTLAAVQARAEIEAEKIEGIAHVGAVAQQRVALLTQMEQQLTQLVPLAASRLQAIGDLTALGMADVVATAGRRIAR
jgi:hypothetical protein